MDRHLPKHGLLTTALLMGLATPSWAQFQETRPDGRPLPPQAETKSTAADTHHPQADFRRQRPLLSPTQTKATPQRPVKAALHSAASDPLFAEGFDAASALQRFTILDANGDGSTWKHIDSDPTGQGAATIEYGQVDHDDWIITPPLQLKAGMIYNLSYRVASMGISFPELLEVKAGTAPTAEAMTQTVVAQQTITDNEYQTVRQEFIPATDGTYYFGFHCTSSADWCYQLFLDDITVVGQSQKAPDAVTDLTVTAAADGSTEATLRFTTPKKAIDGSALQAPLTITILRNGEEVGEKTNLQPATAYDYTDPNPDEGLNTYSVVAKNAEGTGRESQPIEVYIGLDTPESPSHIQQSQDDTSITLTWSPVTMGEHGGYVNPADIIYNVYEIEETDMGVNLPLIDQVSEPTITIPYETNVGDQEMINYALSAENGAGEGPRVMSPGIIVGAPYTLPFEEHFTGGRLDNAMWWVSGTGDSEIQLMQGMSVDGDGGCAGYVSTNDADWGTMGSGKICLQGASHPTLVFSNLSSVAHAQGKVVVSVSAPGKETKELCTVDYSQVNNTAKQWITTSVELGAEYLSLPYITFAFDVQAPSGEVVYFDQIYIRDVVSKDLRATLRVPSRVRKGETITAQVDVSNMGSTDATDFVVHLYAGSQCVDTKEVSESLAPFGRTTVSLTCPTTVMTPSPLSLRAEVVIDGDATPDDNVASATVDLLASTKTAPANVTATVEDDDRVLVSWQKVTETSETLTEDFERYTPWLPDNFGDWTSVYGDKGVARGPFSRSYPHPNEGERFAFTVVNPASWLPSDLLETYPCLLPHSGDSYLASFYSVENSQFVVADNWLISPSLPGTPQTVTFWANNFQSETLSYPENFEVLYSVSGTTLADFRSTGVKAVAEGGEWKQYAVDLPEGATYFAIHNNTADTYMLMIDDITYTAGCGQVVAYNVYRDNTLLQRVDAAGAAQYTDASVTSGTHVYAVSAVYAGGESEATKAAPVTSVASLLLQGQSSFDLYTVDGQLVTKGLRSLRDLPKGVYVVHGKTLVIQ